MVTNGSNAVVVRGTRDAEHSCAAEPERRARHAQVPLATVSWALLGALAVGCAGPSTGAPLEYQAGPLREYATVHAPAFAARVGAGEGVPDERRAGANASSAAGRKPAAGVKLPTVVVLHGGFWGDDKDSETIGHELAARGALVVIPAYRGEKRSLDGMRSDGKVEFCAGEVDDVQALLKTLRQRPDVDPARISLVGLSHGGCVALRTAAREPSVASVVTFAAPTDAVHFYKHLGEHPWALMGFDGWLEGRLESYVGGTPEKAPDAWRERTPLREAPSIKQPLVLIHGRDDVVVPPEETCMMRDALHASGRPVIERAFDAEGEPAPGMKSLCAPLPDAAKGAPGAAPVEVWFYANEGHGFSSKIARSSQARAYDVLLAPPVPSPAPTADQPAEPATGSPEP